MDRIWFLVYLNIIFMNMFEIKIAGVSRPVEAYAHDGVPLNHESVTRHPTYRFSNLMKCQAMCWNIGVLFSDKGRNSYL